MITQYKTLDGQIDTLEARIADFAEQRGYDAFNEPLWLWLCVEEGGMDEEITVCFQDRDESTNAEKTAYITALKKFLALAEAGQIEEYEED